MHRYMDVTDVFGWAILSLHGYSMWVFCINPKNNKKAYEMARFVVIDDSSFQRRVVCKVVKSEGHILHEGQNGLEGLYRIATYWPDCVLVDLVMPKVDGFGVLEAMQKNNIKIPVVVITADVQDTTKQQCRELGAYAFINKPINETEVVDTIRKVLAETAGN